MSVFPYLTGDCFAHLPWRTVPGKSARNDIKKSGRIDRLVAYLYPLLLSLYIILFQISMPLNLS